MHFFNRYNVERETHRLEKIRGEQKKNLDTYYRFKYVQCTCTKLRARDCFRAF